MHLGQEKDVKKLADINRNSFERENPDFILTICPTGNAMLKNTYPRIIPAMRIWEDKIYDFSEFVVRRGLIPDIVPEMPRGDIFYHFPCHYVNKSGRQEEPLTLLRSIGYNPEIEENSLACCGFSGVFAFKNPEISAHLWEKKEKKVKKTGITTIATDCPGCLFQFKANMDQGKDSYDIYHTAELYAQYIKTERFKQQGNRRDRKKREAIGQ
jgi:Fe-S oxidoreductase